MHLRRFLWPLLVIILTIPTVTSLLRPGIFQMHDDISPMRLFQMEKCFQSNQIPCRWVPDMGFGYGYPQFNYYGPLPYYVMSAFHFLGLDVFSATKLGFALALLLGNVAMFYLGTEFFGPVGGLLSAVAYGYIPYRSSDIYSRGAMGESWAFIFFPIILLCMLRIIRQQSQRNLTLFALAFAGLLVSHNVSTLMFAPFAIFLGLVLIFLHERGVYKTIFYLVLGGIFAIAISGFFFLPVVFEAKLAHTESLLSGYFNYLAHFVSVKQLFLTSFWGYGSSEVGFTDDVAFSYGFIHLLLGLTAMFISLGNLVNKKQVKISLIIITSIFLFLLASFLIHEKSTFIWKLFPILAYLQFPWRFLGISNFFLALIAGFIVFNLQNQVQKILTLIIIFALIFFNLAYFRPNIWFTQTPLEKFSGFSWEKQQTISIFDYLPIAAKFPPIAPAPLYPVTISGGPVSILDFNQGSDSQSFTTQATASAKLQINLLDWPTWRVKIDDKTVPYQRYSDIALLAVDIPSGQHQVNVNLVNSPIRTLGNLLTLIFLPYALVILLRSKHAS